MSSPVSGVTQPDSSSSTSGTTPATSAQTTADPLAQENTFLQLLVAQLQNQDPTQPTDGTQFVTQLAQFTQLEQTTNLLTSVNNIDTLLQQTLAPTATGSGSAGSSSPTN